MLFEPADYVYLEGMWALFDKILSATKENHHPLKVSRSWRVSFFAAVFKVKVMMPMKFETVDSFFLERNPVS